MTFNVGYDSVGHVVQVTDASSSVLFWAAGASSSSTDPLTGPYDALGRLGIERQDSGAVTTTRGYLAGSNMPNSYSVVVQAPGSTTPSTIFAYQDVAWQGTFLR